MASAERPRVVASDVSGFAEMCIRARAEVARHNAVTQSTTQLGKPRLQNGDEMCSRMRCKMIYTLDGGSPP